MITKKQQIIAATATIVIVTLGYLFWPKKNQADSNVIVVKPVDVTTITIAKQSVRQTIELPGRVNAQKIAQIRPQVDGIIKEVKFAEGSFVEKGQQLYQIDLAIYQSAFDAATSNLKTLKEKKERYEVLVINDAVSKQELSDVKAEWAQAQADLSKAKKNLEYTKVLAPISGFIGKTNITEGALVTANQADILTTITQVDPIYVDLEQASKDVTSLSAKDDVTVSLVTSDPTYQNVGQLKFHEMFVDEATDSVRLRAVFKNEDHRLLPGMFVSAKLALPPFEAITVPQRATSRMPNGSLMVWVVDAENTAAPRPIKADKISGDSWIVEDGLNDGDVVILEGIQKIREGAKVNPTQPQQVQ